MIHQMQSGRWVHAHDIMVDIPGRDDTIAEKAVCADYLARRSATRPRTSPQSALKTQSVLAAAHVRNLVVRQPKEPESDQLTAAHKAIDRLLAFVPARAEAIGGARLNEVVEGLVLAAQQAFASAANITALVAPESDGEAEACHRVSLRVSIPADQSAQEVAASVVAVHRRFAENTTVDEHRAILLVVSPEPQAA